MASLSTDKHGRRVIQFTGPTGKRCTLRCGKLRLSAAETLRTRVELLLNAANTKTPADPETVTWLTGIGEALHTKLVDLGLTQTRGASELPKLGEFFDAYLLRREDIKPSTRTNLENA